MDTAGLVALAHTRLAEAADAANAAKMQAYLKTEQPMYGTRRPDQKPIGRELKATFVPEDAAAWRAGVEALWAEPQRELQYAAIDYARGFARRRFLTPDTLPLWERLAREGAWWDLVDEIAVHLVGGVVARHRAASREVLDRWIADDDLWVRRTAILAQIHHKGDTDVEQLFGYCLAQADDPTFWIRKAIGWALRQHARTDPDAVRAFLAAHGDRLSGLSRREASKHL